jgi:hypothetical protein
LGLLLLAQLALAAALMAWQSRMPGSAEPRALFAFDNQAVDRLVIEGPDKARVELRRTGGGKEAAWVVAEAGDFPADAERVRQLLEKLRSLKAGNPVATSAEAIERFKVADAGFERRVSAEGGGKALATLLLGTSQGARQTHVRRAGESGVLALDWPTYELGIKSDDWLDKNALRFPKAEIEAIEVDGLRLVAAAPAPAPASAASAAAPPPAWAASGLAAGHRLSEAAADRLAQAVSDLAFQSLRGRDAGARQGLGAPELRLQVRRRGIAAVEYTLHKLAGSEDRVLVLSSRPETFTLAAHQARTLLDAAKREALVAGAGR